MRHAAEKKSRRRHPALQPLSRDHHFGLVQAQRLIRSSGEGPGAARKAQAEFLAAWDREIADHFASEERLLQRLMGPSARRRLLREHDELRGLVLQSRGRPDGPPDPSLTERIGRLLHDHIRWEERELFPAIEQESTAGELATLETETARIDASRRRTGTNGGQPNRGS